MYLHDCFVRNPETDQLLKVGVHEVPKYRGMDFVVVPTPEARAELANNAKREAEERSNIENAPATDTQYPTDITLTYLQKLTKPQLIELASTIEVQGGGTLKLNEQDKKDDLVMQIAESLEISE